MNARYSGMKVEEFKCIRESWGFRMSHGEYTRVMEIQEESWRVIKRDEENTNG